jgi:hypothetical protein
MEICFQRGIVQKAWRSAFNAVLYKRHGDQLSTPLIQYQYITVLYKRHGDQLSTPLIQYFLFVVLAEGVTSTFIMSDLMSAQRIILGQLHVVWQIGRRTSGKPAVSIFRVDN